jgi:hypothetical protein
MRQFTDLDQIEEPGSAFNGVGGTENAVYELLVDLRAAAFYGQQVRLYRGQMFAAFRQIILYQFVVEVRWRK